ncbi:hypothetical protein ACLB2K_047775 [Fragaria x ananassa]
MDPPRGRARGLGRARGTGRARDRGRAPTVDDFFEEEVLRTLGLTLTPLTRSLCVSSPLCVSIELGTLCGACSLVISGREFLASLIVISDRSYDVILGVDWLRPNHVVINCFDMVVSFHVPRQQSFHYRCHRSDTAMWEGVLAHIEATCSTVGIADIAVVSEFSDVFQKIPGLPPKRGSRVCYRCGTKYFTGIKDSLSDGEN